MITVRLEFLSWLADTLAFTGVGPKSLLVREVDHDKTVKDLLIRLAQENPLFQKSVFNTRDLRLNHQVAIFHNGRHIELESGLQTKLSDGDTLTFVPFIQGG